MRKLGLAVVFSSLAALAGAVSAASVPAKPELAGISLGSSWAKVSATIGAEDLRCTASTAIPPIDQMCLFKLRKGPGYLGFPIQEDIALGLSGDKVVFVGAALQSIEDSDEERLRAAMKAAGRTWHMNMPDAEGEMLLVSVDLTKKPANKAASDAALASTTMMAKGENDGTVSLYLGSLMMMVQLAEQTQR